MGAEGSARLDALARSLRDQRAALDAAGETVDEAIPAAIEALVREVARLVPTASVRFERLDHAAGFEGLQRQYRARTLVAVVDACLASLEDAGAGSGDDLPALDLSFVTDPPLREALARNDAEMRLAHQAGCWKAVTILAGGIIEAALWDRLKRPAERDFKSLIQDAHKAGLVGKSVQGLAQAARICRNAVHVSAELRDPLPIDRDQARLQMEILLLTCKELAGTAR